MSSDATTKKTRWNLGELYHNVEDPRLLEDCHALIGHMTTFAKTYRGTLATKLGDALTALSEISMLESKISGYLLFVSSLDTGDTVVKKKYAEITRLLSAADAEHMTFFSIELCALDEASIDAQRNHPEVAKHAPWIAQVRIRKPYLLSEAVETALGKRAPFGPATWSDFFDELESDIEIQWGDAKKTLTEMLHLLSESSNAEERAKALEAINTNLGGMFAKYSAETLYMVAGSAALEQKERGYRHPMQSRNLSNQVDEKTVEALHKAMIHTAPLLRRFYALKAKHLGLRTLRWSDRNAPLTFTTQEPYIPFAEALETVKKAYKSFSPTLCTLVEEMAAQSRIDAPATKGKRGGAYNCSLVLPGNTAASWTFLNYLGSRRDVMTLAHELGHGVHGILAGRAQGPLMYHAPIAYCETASVFGEMITYDYLRAEMETASPETRLAFVMGKLDDMINTTYRQIGFSNFERRLHGMDATYSTWGDVQKLSPKDIAHIWKDTMQELYGPEGEVFTYEHTDNLWAYISHFHTPFYVYGYAFGELLTQSMYAKREQLGDSFEPNYRALLESGSTKNVVELMAPFGLDPTHETFWVDGIEGSIGRMITEAEKLSEML